MAPHTAELSAAPAVEVEFRPPGIALVKLHGEHDLSSQKCLSEALAAASAKRDVLIDLSDCTFMDSSVIAELFRARRKLNERGGRLELVIPESATTIKRVADVTHLAAILPIHQTRRAAIARIRTGDHSIRIRDLRLRFGGTESYAAECSCGWTGDAHTRWQTAAREARRDGAVHVDQHRVRRA
jgi:anti-sigma B factor antagonist